MVAKIGTQAALTVNLDGHSLGSAGSPARVEILPVQDIVADAKTMYEQMPTVGIVLESSDLR